MARVCRPKVLVPLLAAVTATAFALAAARVSLAGDTAVFTTLRFEHQGLQEFFGAFDFTVPVILGGVLLFVGNQHKWDRLGPEKIIIMKSCVGAP